MSAGFWIVVFFFFFFSCLTIGLWLLNKFFDWWMESSTDRMVERERKERMKLLGIEENT